MLKSLFLESAIKLFQLCVATAAEAHMKIKIANAQNETTSQVIRRNIGREQLKYPPIVVT